jgi:hypothetical protein
MLTSVNSTDAARCPLSPCNDLIDINATYRAPIDWREGRGARPTRHDLADLLGQVVHVPVAPGLELDLLLEDHGAPLVSGSLAPPPLYHALRTSPK